MSSSSTNGTTRADTDRATRSIRRLATARRVPSTLSHGSAGARAQETTRFLQVLWALEHEVQTSQKLMMRTLGISASQLAFLRVVGAHGPIGPTEVAAFLQVDRSTMTPHVAKLREKGLLSVDPDANDSRRLSLRLTARGRRLDQLHRGSMESIVDEALRRVPRAAAQNAIAVLVGIVDEARTQLGPARRTWRGTVAGARR